MTLEKSPIPCKQLENSEKAKEVAQYDDTVTFTPQLRRCYFALICLGYTLTAVCSTLHGPSMTALSVILNCNMDDISDLITIKVIFYGIVSFLTKYAYAYFNRHLLLIFSLATYSIATALIPFCPNLICLGIVESVLGCAISLIDSATILGVLQLYSQKSKSQVQIVYFSYALGRFWGPLLAGKFLPSKSLNPNIFSGPVFGPNEDPYQLLYIPFVASSALLFSCACALMVLQRIKPFIPTDRKMESKVEDVQDKETKKLPSSYFMVVIVFSLLQLSLVSGLEEIGSVFFSTFLSKGTLQIGEDIASYLCSFTALTFTIGRLLNIFLTRFLPIKALQTIYFVVLAIGYIFLNFLNFDNAYLIWFCVPFMGVGESPVYPLTLSFLEKRTNVTNTIQMAIQVMGTGFAAVALFTIGKWLEQSTCLYVNVCLGFVTAMLVVFIVLILTDVWKKRLLCPQDRQVLVN